MTDDLENSALSLVVFYELTATKITPRKRQDWEKFLREHHKAKTLVIPSMEDWRIASRLGWLMLQHHEKIPLTATGLQNDILICQSAASFSDDPPIIVTENIKHFSLIAAYINENRKKTPAKLTVVSAKEYFQ